MKINVGLVMVACCAACGSGCMQMRLTEVLNESGRAREIVCIKEMGVSQTDGQAYFFGDPFPKVSVMTGNQIKVVYKNNERLEYYPPEINKYLNIGEYGKFKSDNNVEMATQYDTKSGQYTIGKAHYERLRFSYEEYRYTNNYRNLIFIPMYPFTAFSDVLFQPIYIMLNHESKKPEGD